MFNNKKKSIKKQNNNNNNYQDDDDTTMKDDYEYSPSKLQKQDMVNMNKQEIIYTELLIDSLNNCFIVYDNILNEINNKKNITKNELLGWTAQCTGITNLVGSMSKEMVKNKYKIGLNIISNRLKIYLNKKNKNELNKIEPFLRYIICCLLNKKPPIIPTIAIDINTFNSKNVNNMFSNFLGKNHKIKNKINNIQKNSNIYKKKHENENILYNNQFPNFNNTKIPTNDEYYNMLGGTKNVKLTKFNNDDENITVSQQIELNGDECYDNKILHIQDIFNEITKKEKNILNNWCNVNIFQNNKKFKNKIKFNFNENSIQFKNENSYLFTKEIEKIIYNVKKPNFFKIFSKMGNQFVVETENIDIKTVWVRCLGTLDVSIICK